MSCRLLTSAAELQEALQGSSSVGFVPTMGALHEGHGLLLERCVEECETGVLSVFVNPTQFGPTEDYSRYPRTLEADLELASRKGIRYLFAPAPETVYPPGFSTFVEVAGVSEPLCGRFRPGHFRGVATVVLRLFQLVRPGVAYFGQKDLQQCLVIDRMAKDLLLPVKIAVCPTVREPDGLALSSRNRYLSAEERLRATVIWRALQAAQERFSGGERSARALEAVAAAVLATLPGFRMQYCEIRALPFLRETERIEGPAALAIAGHLGSTRLIDNHIFEG